MKQRSERISILAFLLPVFSGLIFIALSVSVLALIMTKKDIPLTLAYKILLGLIGLGMFLAGFTAGVKLRIKGIAAGGIVSGIILIILLLLFLIINSFRLNPLIYICCPIFLLSGSVGGIVASNLR